MYNTHNFYHLVDFSTTPNESYLKVRRKKIRGRLIGMTVNGAVSSGLTGLMLGRGRRLKVGGLSTLSGGAGGLGLGIATTGFYKPKMPKSVKTPKIYNKNS